MALHLRPAVVADGARMLDWQRHPDVRRHFRDPRVPDEKEHWAWLRAKLADPAAFVTILEDDGNPAGALRLDRRDARSFEVSILVDPARQGRGLGRQALERARRRFPGADLVATVLPGNEASARLFRSAGYAEEQPGAWRHPAPGTALPGPRIAIHADGGQGIGLGHASRCAGLAKALARRGAVPVMLVAPDSGLAPGLAAMGLTLQDCPGDARALGQAAAGMDLLVADSYRLDRQVLRQSFPGPLAWFDDTAAESCAGAAVINGSPAAQALPYRIVPPTLALLGPDYQVVREGLSFRERRGPVRRLLATYGGSDPLGVGPHLARVLADSLPPEIAVDFVVGPFAIPPVDLPARFRMHHSPPDLPALMAEADLAVSAGGQTLFELMACGLPILAFGTGEDQRPNLETLTTAGAIAFAGWAGSREWEAGLGTLLHRFLEDEAWRAGLAATGRRTVDGRGADRIAGALTILALAGHDT